MVTQKRSDYEITKNLGSVKHFKALSTYIKQEAVTIEG